MPDFKPMLSAKIDTSSIETVAADLSKLSYPLIASPKIDGIRVVIDPNLGAVTRTLKRVPNRHIYNRLTPVMDPIAGAFNGLDGEITIGSPDLALDKAVFNSTQSGVMSYDGEPQFTFWVFDDFTHPEHPYRSRLNNTGERVEHLKVPYIKSLEFSTVYKANEVLELEESYLKRGFEGIMLRGFNTAYKYGRATLKQQQLIKLKRREDGEAVVIDYKPLFENHNEPTQDNLGHQKRSSAKAGKVETEMLGTLVLQPTAESGFTQHFELGSGFDDATRIDLWNRRGDLIGRRVSFKYQAVGVKDKPRFPIFKGFRED